MLVAFTLGMHVLLILVLVLCLLHYRKKSPYGKIGFGALGVTMIAMDLCYMVALMLPNNFLGRLFYCIYSALSTWLLFLLIRFTMLYLNLPKKILRMTLLLIPLIILDSISMVANSVFQHAFVFSLKNTMTGEPVLAYTNLFLNNVHEIFCILLALICVMVPTISMRKNNSFARLRNSILLGAQFFLLIGEAFYFILRPAIDLTTLICSVSVLLFYYLSYIFASREITRRSLGRVAQEMQELLLVFDEHDRCAYMNDSAIRFFAGIGVDRMLLESSISEWFLQEKARDKENITDADFTIANNGKLFHFRVSYHSFIDNSPKIAENKRYMGSFFILLDTTSEYEHRRREHYLATHDPLTGLDNLANFERKVAKRLREDSQTEYVLLFSDIKEFKLINDLFGKPAGDNLLRNIASCIEKYSQPDWLYCRANSDRFAILLKKSEHSDERLLRLTELVQYLDEDSSYSVHVYIGVYEIEDRNMTVSVMCDRAYRAISSIKGSFQRIAYYDKAMHERAEQEQRLVNELPLAMSQKHIVLFLQPQVSPTGSLLGAEALVRWIHPEKGMLSPGMFIPLLEGNGMISMLDRYIWQSACQTLKRWEQAGLINTYISVNISPIDIYFMDIHQVFTSLVKQYDLDPKRLKLEITETAIAKNVEKQMDLIHALRQSGFYVEMDDFGSGYSSLNMLKDIEIDALKIDMAFLRKSHNEPRARTILKMVVELSQQIGMPVIIEGVEHEEHVSFLSQIGCKIFQGYYFARPMSVSDFEGKYLPQLSAL